MKIVMLKDGTGSPNGKEVSLYKKGEEYNVSDLLYKAFVLDLKIAIVVIENNMESKAIITAPQKQVIVDTPQNKEIKIETKTPKKEVKKNINKKKKGK